MSITTTQHSALGDLRRFGALYPSPRAHRGSPFGFSERTLQALVDAGYARWDVVRATTGAGTSIMRGIVPVEGSPEDDGLDPDNLTGMDLGDGVEDSPGDPLGIVTPDPRKTCPVARFGRPHIWTTGAFYHDGRLIETEDYVKCGACGQVERDV